MSSMTANPGDALDGAPCPTSVYRYYDRHGLLIYVGITKQGIGRNRQHNGKAEWWQHVVRQEVDHYDSRPAAAKCEKELIGAFRPPFNKQYNADYAATRHAYLAFVASLDASEPIYEQYRRSKGLLPLDVVQRDGLSFTLRSRLAHCRLAAAIDLRHRSTPIMVVGKGRPVAFVQKVTREGSFIFVHCAAGGERVKDSASVAAALKWRGRPDPTGIRVGHLIVDPNPQRAGGRMI